MEQNQNPLAPGACPERSLGAATDEPASPLNPSAEEDRLTDFEPVPLRYRRDGLTPAKQREYVEALADCGVARHAAGRIGVSEQAIARVRRRADARAFDLACEAAQKIGARHIRSVAYERAIEGTIKRHYYHGELKSEEVVYDNRLLVYLLGKTAHLVDPPAEAQAVIDNWEPWMEAIEQGLPAPGQAQRPEPGPAAQASAAPESEPLQWDDECFEVTEEDVWEEFDGSGWWTRFPPPAGFEGVETEKWGEEGYMRTLTDEEVEAVEAERDRERLDRLEPEIARRDWYFGFAGGNDEAEELLEEEEEGEEDRPSDTVTGEAGGDAGARAGPASAQAEVFPSREAETHETSGAAAAVEAALGPAQDSRKSPPDPARPEPRIRSL